MRNIICCCVLLVACGGSGETGPVPSGQYRVLEGAEFISCWDGYQETHEVGPDAFLLDLRWTDETHATISFNGCTWQLEGDQLAGSLWIQAEQSCTRPTQLGPSVTYKKRLDLDVLEDGRVEMHSLHQIHFASGLVCDTTGSFFLEVR